MIKRISAICGLILALGAILGLVYTLDSRWAKAADVALVAQRLDEKIAGDRADRIQEKVWKDEKEVIRRVTTLGCTELIL
jgi:hypothetical protein